MALSGVVSPGTYPAARLCLLAQPPGRHAVSRARSRAFEPHLPRSAGSVRRDTLSLRRAVHLEDLSLGCARPELQGFVAFGALEGRLS